MVTANSVGNAVNADFRKKLWSSGQSARICAQMLG
jgi:hypothetical protein